MKTGYIGKIDRNYMEQKCTTVSQIDFITNRQEMKFKKCELNW